MTVMSAPKGWHHACGDDGGFFTDSESLFLKHLDECEVRVNKVDPEEVARRLEGMRKEYGYDGD